MTVTEPKISYSDLKVTGTPSKLAPFYLLGNAFFQYLLNQPETQVHFSLGARAASRFVELKEIRPCWNFGHGEALTEESEESFLQLAKSIQQPPENPRLFLKEDGLISLQWKDADGRRFAIRCVRDGYIFHQQDFQETIHFEKDQIASLLLMAGLADSGE